MKLSEAGTLEDSGHAVVFQMLAVKEDGILVVDDVAGHAVEVPESLETLLKERDCSLEKARNQMSGMSRIAEKKSGKNVDKRTAHGLLKKTADLFDNLY